MVWHTNTGDRILEGREAELYLRLGEAIGYDRFLLFYLGFNE